MGWLRRRKGGGLPDCREVGRVLQSYLDGELDESTARRIGAHLELCQRCGLEAATYLEIRRCLERRARTLPDDSLERLRTFATRLTRSGLDRRGRSSPT
ncbi:MAG TPA: zf-HC2 domain-containing protein [Acidimicrobiales bacterium]|nr:zf-HC2 domain-containing protein [Acidimicrobiales bacterium]